MRLNKTALIVLLGAAPLAAQRITVARPLPDGNRDGRITVTDRAASLGVARGTVLTRCGGTLTYVGPKSTCPGSMPVASPAAKSMQARQPTSSANLQGVFVTPPAPPHLSAPVSQTGTKLIGSGGSKTNLTITGVGTATRAKAGLVDGYTFADIVMHGSQYLFQAYTARDWLRHATISRVASIDSGPGFLKLRGDVSGLLIEDVSVQATRANTDCSRVTEGIGLQGKTGTDTGSGIVIRRVRIDGIRSSGCRFLNGDGISVERGYQNISITDAESSNNSDAGFDIKSASARLDRVVARSNRRNFKLWADQAHGLLVSIDPGQPGSGAAAHIQIQGARHIRIARLIARAALPIPIFEVENAGTAPAVIDVGSCEMAVPVGTPLIASPGTATVHLGPGCDTRKLR